jgi:hypothetical protein
MANRATIIDRLDRMIARLSKPLLPSDVRDGWSEEARKAILEVLEELRARLLNDQPLTAAEKELSISRGMDSWGVVSGDLLEEGAEISNQLRELKS